MNAIVIMVIGSKYEKILESTREQFEKYANKCGAQLEICREIPDPSMHSHLLTQKMLLPQLYSKYEWIAFMDLDIVISKIAPSIFDQIQNGKGFGAVLDPHGEDIFFKSNHYWFSKSPDQITQLEDRFKNEGFEYNSKIIGIINGGIWVANTKAVGKLFSDFYFKQNKQNEFFEEIPMSFISQNAELFFPLDNRFNNQLIYFSCEKNAIFNTFIIKMQEKINQVLRKFIQNKILFFPQYISMIEKKLESNYILHFSGGFPAPPKLKNALYSSSNMHHNK